MKILFSQQPRFIELAKLLHAKEHEIISVTPNFAKSLNDIDIPAKDINSFLQNSTREEAISYAAKLIAFLPKMQYNLNGLGKGPRAYIERGFPVYLYQRVSEVAGLVGGLDDAKPDFVIVHNDVDIFHRAIAMWAKARGVPCLHIPHSVYLPSDGRGKAGTDVHDLITASHLAAAGPFQRDWFIERGFKKENIRETGLHQFDQMLAARRGRELARKMLKLDAKAPVIAYASSWRQDTNLLGCHTGVEDSYTRFLDAIAQMPPVQVIVKTHPSGGNIQWHYEEAGKRGVECLVTATHLPIVLSAADLVVSYGPSNILLESALVPNVKLVAIGGFEDDGEVFKISEDAQADEISKGLVDVLLSAPVDLSGFRYKYMGKVDGKSSNRIVGFIEEICQ